MATLFNAVAFRVIGPSLDEPSEGVKHSIVIPGVPRCPICASTCVPNLSFTLSLKSAPVAPPTPAGTAAHAIPDPEPVLDK